MDTKVEDASFKAVTARWLRSTGLLMCGVGSIYLLLFSSPHSQVYMRVSNFTLFGALLSVFGSWLSEKTRRWRYAYGAVLVFGLCLLLRELVRFF
jgi:xanthine/uracil permease